MQGLEEVGASAMLAAGSQVGGQEVRLSLGGPPPPGSRQASRLCRVRVQL